MRVAYEDTGPPDSAAGGPGPTARGAAPQPGLPMQRPLLLRTRDGGRGRPVADWPRVSMIVPTLNEERNIGPILDELPDGLHEVIIIDGGSTDGTVRAAHAARPGCLILQQPGRGKGDALAFGFAHATGDIIVTLDADGSADPAEIPLFIGALLAGADFTKGSRYVFGGGSADLTRIRSVGNRALGVVVNVLFGTRYTDVTYGYNAFWRECASALAIDCQGFEVETLMNIRAIKAGLHVSEVPCFERPRRHGASKLNAMSDGWRVLKTILRERRTSAPAPPVISPVVERGA
jgi:glycosyltransferase involved in cell wall biosynthesis